MVVVGGFLVGAILFAQVASPVHRIMDPLQFESFLSLKQLFSAEGLDAVPGKAPDVTITTLEGKQLTMEELYSQNQLVVVNFWATWCRPCLEEMPDLQKAHLAYKDKGVAILGVARDKSASGVEEFIAKQKITYEIALDDQDKMANAFGGVNVLPTTIFIDSNHNILKIHKGYISGKDLDKNLKDLLLNGHNKTNG